MAYRVVSLVPCLTETVLALGGEVVQLVGCTEYCDLQAVEGTIGATVTRVGGPKTPDVAAIVESSPDLVLVDPEENRVEDARAMEAAGLELFVARVGGPEGVPDLLERLGRAMGCEPGEEPARLRAWLEGAATGAQGAARAVTLVWREPYITIGPGTYGAGVLRWLGIETVKLGVGAEDAAQYPRVSREQLEAAAPDLLVLPSEPYEFSQDDAREFERAFGGEGGNTRVVLVDGRDLFWYGVRTRSALTRLAGRLRHEGG